MLKINKPLMMCKIYEEDFNESEGQVLDSRPSSTIITGNIKANFPARIAFRTTTGFESRIIIDCAGAEILAGNGDMLFCMGADITRSQCAYVDTDYIYNFRDELTKHYEGIENPPLLIEEVSKTQSKNGTIQQEYEAHIYLTLYIPHESKLRNK